MTRASRGELRAELMARVPPRYSPWLHLFGPTAFGLLAAALALSQVRDLRAWQAAFVPAFLVFGNAVEWWVHRRLLHRRTRFVQAFYLRHTPQHHAIFVAEDMGIEGWRELKLVLLPAYAILGILVVTSPVTLALVAIRQPNLAALWVASAVTYLLAYEWLHLAYHLPQRSRLGRTRLIQRLRRHHQVHHAPHLMQRWNFNVTLPLWDRLRGTLYRPGAPLPHPASAPQRAR